MPPASGEAQREFQRLVAALEGTPASDAPPGPEDAGLHFLAWATRCDDVEGEMQRLAARGFAVAAPMRGGRRRPDGTRLEWVISMAVSLPLVVGTKVQLPPGFATFLPFFIQDLTARELRVPPPAVPPGGDAELLGVGAVVIAVQSLGRAVTIFQRAYDFELPAEGESEALDADLAVFPPAAPVVLASPRGPASPLAMHLESQGEGLCAILIETGNLAAAGRRFELLAPEAWYGRQAAWIDPGRLLGHRVGFIG